MSNRNTLRKDINRLNKDASFGEGCPGTSPDGATESPVREAPAVRRGLEDSTLRICPTTTTYMKPASKTAIEAASQLLLDSVAEENGEASDGQSDITTLASLSKEAELLDVALQSIYGSLSRRVADKRRQRNIQTPIYRLPPEMLVKIFLLCITQIELRDHVTTLHNLARVSYRWACAIRETPAVWAFLSSELPQSLFQTVLKRSQNATLTLNLGPVYGERGFDPLLEACQHVARWGSASLTLHLIKTDVKEYLERPAPQIAHINITAFAAPLSLNLFGGQADRLRHLQLNGVGIPLDTPMISGLTHLELRNFPNFPSIDNLIRIFRSSPLIQSLILGLGQRVPEPSHALESEQPLVLEHLTTLRLFSLPHKYSNALLRGLQIPTCQQLTIQTNVSGPAFWPAPGTHEPPPPIPMAEVVGPCIDTVRRIVVTATKLCFRIGIQSFVLDDGPDSSTGDLVIALTGFENTEKFVWFTQTFKDELKNKSFTVALTQAFAFTDPLFFPALEGLTNVVTLSVEGRTVETRRLFDYLSERTVENDVKRWHLPHLRELVIASSEPSEHQELVSVLQRRYGLVGDNGVDSNLPAKLDTLRVACRDQAMQQQFRSIVGPEAFHEISPFDYAFGAGMLPADIPPTFTPAMGGLPDHMGHLPFDFQEWGDVPMLGTHIPHGMNQMLHGVVEEDSDEWMNDELISV